MSKMLKRVLPVMLSAALLIGVAAPVSDAAAAAPQNSWEINKSEPVTLTLFYDKTTATTDSDRWWGKDVVSKKWIEETNVNIEFQFAPDNEHSKLNVLIAGGDLPDIIVADKSLPIIQQMALNDRVWAVNELEKTAAPGFVERNFPKGVIVQTRMQFNTMDLYALPFYHLMDDQLDDPLLIKNVTGMAVIDKLYEQAGSPKLTSIDDLLNLLRKVKEQNPDIIPAQGSRGSGRDGDGNVRLVFKLFPYFGLNGNYVEYEGKYIKYWHHPNFLELLKTVNTMYNEGLMDKTEFTDQTEQLQAKEFSGKLFADLNQDANNIDWFNNELHKVKPEWNFIMIDPPAYDTDVGFYNDGFGKGLADSMGGFITKNENAERALQWMDFLYTDQTQFELLYGMEGEAFDYNEEGFPIQRPEFQTGAMPDEQKKGVYGVGAYWILRNGYWAAIQSITSASEAQRTAMNMLNKYYKDRSFFAGASPEAFDPNSDEMKIRVAVKEFYEVEVMKILIAAPDRVESMYRAMMEGIAELGQGTIDTIINDHYQNKAALEAKYSADLN